LILGLCKVWLAAAALGFIGSSAGQPAGQPPGEPKPNVVFILVDDMGWRDLGVEGSTYYQSPRIDALARSGVRFERAYAASRVCSPSRASIMTGQTPARHGITTWIGDDSGESWRRQGRHDSHLPADYTRELPHEAVTLAEAFRGDGYATFFAGKWHLGGPGSWPEDHGFDINVGGWDVGSPKGGFFAPWDNPNLPSGPDGESLTLRLANETASFIEQSADQPFFAFLSFYAVHGPIQTTRDKWSTFRDRAEGIAVDGQRFEFDRRAERPRGAGLPDLRRHDRDARRGRGHRARPARGLGLADNTIVCFTSDNGGVSSGDAYSTSNLPLRGGKGMQWEGGTRVPAYIRVPGVDTARGERTAARHGLDAHAARPHANPSRDPADDRRHRPVHCLPANDRPSARCSSTTRTTATRAASRRRSSSKAAGS
jgi:arylsulfatase A-like enzyme